MGLLQKATEQKSYTPSLREDKFTKIKSDLSSIKNSLEFHHILFKELVELLAIDKGALLIKDGSMFSLSSIIGYDETTKNRLRMNFDEYNEFKDTNDTKILEKYFSIREFVTLKNIDLYPFKNSNNIEGILLISEFKIDIVPPKTEILKYVEELAPLFIENPLNRLKNSDTQGLDIKESITSYLQTMKNESNRVLILKLSLQNLIESLVADNKLSTSDSIKSSAIKILTSFTRDRGKVFRLYNNDILLTMLDKNCTINITVVQQQITSAFKSIFSNKIKNVDYNFETLIWNDNSLSTILDHFITNAAN